MEIRLTIPTSTLLMVQIQFNSLQGLVASHLEGLILPPPKETSPESDPLMNKYKKYDDFQDQINSNKTHRL